ncbi:MAG TPA: GNAT family N-acetyltransferase [Cyclobacteriaceae bacterium]|nr:GNAT family N-acetyltransferase [Cyclobacteriaceae bacterium]
MTISIREASISDKAQLMDFQIAMASETEDIVLDRNILDLGISAVFNHAEKGRYLIAEFENKVVGCLMLTFEWSDWRNGTVIWIQSVFVDKQYRGKGIYKALYQHVQNEAQNSQDIRGIRLYVDKRNKLAQEVYEKLGMNGEHYQVYEWMKN